MDNKENFEFKSSMDLPDGWTLDELIQFWRINGLKDCKFYSSRQAVAIFDSEGRFILKGDVLPDDIFKTGKQ